MILRDSVDPNTIPLDNLSAVAGYGDGIYIWSSGGWARFQSPIVSLSIVISASHSGDILDVENGDATPDQVPGWVRAFNRPGRRAATIYCNRSTWPLVIAALQNAGIDPLSVDYWISTLDRSQSVSVPNGGKTPVAIQYVDTGAYDESIILDPTWIGGSIFMALSDQQQTDLYNRVTALYVMFTHGGDVTTPLPNWGDVWNQTLAAVPTAGTALTSTQSQQLNDLAAAVARMEAAAKAA